MDGSEILQAIYYSIGLLLAALFSGISAWLANKAKKSLEEVNDAVNHRHEKHGLAAPKLYDAVIHLHEKVDDLAKSNSNEHRELLSWKHQYDGGPLDTGEKAVNFVKETNQKLTLLTEKVDQLHFKCKGEK